MELDPETWVLSDKTYDPSIDVGTHMVEEEVFNVYPNPSAGSFSIQLEKSFTGEKVSLVIFDINGKIVQHQEVNSLNVSIKGLQKGIYLLKISNNRLNYFERLIVY